MQRLGCLFVGRFYQAVPPATHSVIPISQVLDPMLLLNRQVPPVRIPDSLTGQALDLAVHIQVQRHLPIPSVRSLFWCSVVPPRPKVKSTLEMRSTAEPTQKCVRGGAPRRYLSNNKQ